LWLNESLSYPSKEAATIAQLPEEEKKREGSSVHHREKFVGPTNDPREAVKILARTIYLMTDSAVNTVLQSVFSQGKILLDITFLRPYDGSSIIIIFHHNHVLITNLYG
jgi:hypothetical protein